MPLSKLLGLNRLVVEQGNEATGADDDDDVEFVESRPPVRDEVSTGNHFWRREEVGGQGGFVSAEVW